jgi:hypothetical protein
VTHPRQPLYASKTRLEEGSIITVFEEDLLPAVARSRAFRDRETKVGVTVDQSGLRTAASGADRRIAFARRSPRTIRQATQRAWILSLVHGRVLRRGCSEVKSIQFVALNIAVRGNPVAETRAPGRQGPIGAAAACFVCTANSRPSGDNDNPVILSNMFMHQGTRVFVFRSHSRMSQFAFASSVR